MARVTRVVIIGGGPAGTRRRWSAAQLGAEVTVVDPTASAGRRCSPTACRQQDADRHRRGDDRASQEPPSSGIALVAASDGRTPRPCPGRPGRGERAGASDSPPTQSPTSPAGSTRDGVEVVAGRGRLDGPERVVVERRTAEQTLDADVVLVATGAAPRTLPDRAARRRADPHLGAGLRPRRAARAADRGRLGRDRRGVRQRLQRARLEVDAGVLAATGCCPARTRTPPRCSRRSSPGAGMTVLSRSRAESVDAATATGSRSR